MRLVRNNEFKKWPIRNFVKCMLWYKLRQKMTKFKLRKKSNEIYLRITAKRRAFFQAMA